MAEHDLQPSVRDFHIVQSELELTVLRLKRLSDRHTRRRLLKKLRLLLEEADRILESDEIWPR